MFEWTDELSIDRGLIDSQHQEMFRQINELMEAMRIGRGSAEISKLFEFLSAYVVSHFSAEERSMKLNDYPGYPSHQAEHAGFMQDISQLREQHERGRIAIASLLDVQQRTCDWLKDHIKKNDKALGDYLRERKAPAMGSQGH